MTMVQMHDFGCAERERMVNLAIEHGWVQMVLDAAEHPSVAVLAAEDALQVDGGGPPARLADMLKQAWQLWRAGETTKTMAVQRASGCQPFAVIPVAMKWLCAAVPGDFADELRAAARDDAYPVMCLTADRVALVCGVSRNDGPNPFPGEE
jgi:hypothetical protein